MHELTGREHTAFTIIEADNDESDAIEGLGWMGLDTSRVRREMPLITPSLLWVADSQDENDLRRKHNPLRFHL